MIIRNQLQLARFQKTKLARIQRFDSFDIFGKFKCKKIKFAVRVIFNTCFPLIFILLELGLQLCKNKNAILTLGTVLQH